MGRWLGGICAATSCVKQKSLVGDVVSQYTILCIRKGFVE